jgi:hypothetical protein
MKRFANLVGFAWNFTPSVSQAHYQSVDTGGFERAERTVVGQRNPN